MGQMHLHPTEDSTPEQAPGRNWPMERSPNRSRFSGRTSGPWGTHTGAVSSWRAVPWKGHTLEQLLKNCSPWEGPVQEPFMKDSILGEGPHAREGEKREGEGAVEKCILISDEIEVVFLTWSRVLDL